MEGSRKIRVISVVVATVAACCQLVVLWLTLEENQSKKQHRITYLSGKEWVKEILTREGPQCQQNQHMSPNYEIALTGAERSLVNAPEMVMDNTNMNESFGTQPHELDDVGEADVPQHSVNSPGCTSTPSGQTSTNKTSKKLKFNTSDEVKEKLDNVANAIYALAEQMNPHQNLLPKIIAVVTSLPTIPRHQKMPVIDFVACDYVRAVTFMSLDDEMKVEWLQMNFNVSSYSRHP